MRMNLIWLFAVQALLNTNANENDSHSRRRPHPTYLLFSDFRRACASSRSTTIFECYPKMCDLFANQGHSLYFGAGAPVQKRSTFSKVLPAPIIQCQNELVKSFL